MSFVEFKGTVKVSYRNKNSNGHEAFKNEDLKLSQSSKIAIINLSGEESELISTLKLWNELDLSEGVKTFLKFNTLPMIDSNREYYIHKISEDEQMVILNWEENY